MRRGEVAVRGTGCCKLSVSEIDCLLVRGTGYWLLGHSKFAETNSPHSNLFSSKQRGLLTATRSPHSNRSSSQQPVLVTPPCSPNSKTFILTALVWLKAS